MPSDQAEWEDEMADLSVLYELLKVETAAEAIDKVQEWMDAIDYWKSRIEEEEPPF